MSSARRPGAASGELPLAGLEVGPHEVRVALEREGQQRLLVVPFEVRR